VPDPLEFTLQRAETTDGCWCSTHASACRTRWSSRFSVPKQPMGVGVQRTL